MIHIILLLLLFADIPGTDSHIHCSRRSRTPRGRKESGQRNRGNGSQGGNNWGGGPECGGGSVECG